MMKTTLSDYYYIIALTMLSFFHSLVSRMSQIYGPLVSNNFSVLVLREICRKKSLSYLLKKTKLFLNFQQKRCCFFKRSSNKSDSKRMFFFKANVLSFLWQKKQSLQKLLFMHISCIFHAQFMPCIKNRKSYSLPSLYWIKCSNNCSWFNWFLRLGRF